MSQGTAPTAERRPRTVLHWIIQITGELLITIGLLLLLFVAWQLWWTNIDADRTQSQAVSTLVQEFDSTPAEPLPDWDPNTPPAGLSEPGHGEVFGVVYIPKFGSDYQRPATQGTSSDVLDSLGLGHYEGSAMPGQVGNFSLAGHRQTRGKVLNDIDLLTGTGDVIALDAKLNFDSNALFRHADIVEMRDLDEEDPAEVEASKFDLAYIQLDGNIGCLVNGAGLAMATMDTIKLFGGSPANFLDVGGGATAEKVTEAFKLMLKNKGVKAILVNIFGGIMRCDTIAAGVIAASKAVNLSVPLVVRMKGTNEELGKQMLADSGLPIIAADTMADAARQVVAAAAGK